MCEVVTIVLVMLYLQEGQLRKPQVPLSQVQSLMHEIKLTKNFVLGLLLLTPKFVMPVGSKLDRGEE